MPDRQLNSHSAIEVGVERFLDGVTGGRTRRAYTTDLAQFARFLHTCIAGPTVANVTPEAVDAFVVHLSDSGRRPRTVARKLSAVRTLFRSLCTAGVCTANPARAARAPAPASAPAPPTPEQVRALLALPERDSFTGARNRAILELLYGVGLRLDELVRLNLSHLDVKDTRLRLAGSRPRALRLGPTTTDALVAYLLRRAEVLVELEIATVDAGALFVSARGRRLHPRSIQRVVEHYLRVVENRQPTPAESPGRQRGPGTLRAACARHLVDAGADPGLVAALLGSARTLTRPVDPEAELERLTACYQQAHPRA